MSRKKHRPEYEALIDRIVSGELTRSQAALISQERTGLSPQTFLGWITANKDVKERLAPTKGTVGANNIHAHKDPDKAKAYEEAVIKVLKGMSGAEAARKFDVNYQYLMRKVAAVQSTMEEGAKRDKVRAAAGTLPESTRYLDLSSIPGSSLKGMLASTMSQEDYLEKGPDAHAAIVFKTLLFDGVRAKNRLLGATSQQDRDSAAPVIDAWDKARSEAFVVLQKLATARKAMLEKELDLDLAQLKLFGSEGRRPNIEEQFKEAMKDVPPTPGSEAWKW